MKYIINQKIFSIGDKFVIKDEYGSERYFVEGKVFSLGDKLKIYDSNGQERIYIEQKLFKLLPEYYLYFDGNFAAKVKQAFSLLRPKFQIESPFGSYSVEGDFFGYDFRIMKNSRLVAHVSKKLFSFRDSYGVDIVNDENDLLILAVVIVIDQVIHDEDHHRNH